jgi:cytochrome c peroxidase
MSPRSRRPGWGARLAGAAVALTAGLGPALAEPLPGGGLLPAGTDFGEPALEVPRQILAAERQGGRQSFLVALGNLLFDAPGIFGGRARRAGISCATCHVSGEANPALFLPGQSSRPGNVDVTGPLFNPKADDGLFNPLDIPSLRGIKSTAPYGRDGRSASLREFTRNVIVNEFAGAEPAQVLLDALVAYMEQFEFLPNPRLAPSGQLTEPASAAARRGAALFRKPFPGADGLSCAACHLPSGLFVDRRQHDVGTGGGYDTPTLLNLDFTAPYFHDGGAATLEEVVGHFDRFYGLGLDPAARADLVAYLRAIGDGEAPRERKDVAFDMAELTTFAGTLETTLAERDPALTRLIVDTVDRELREIAERWYQPADRKIRALIGAWAVQLRRVDSAAARGAWVDARAALTAYRAAVEHDLPSVAAAQSRSTYDPAARAAYLADRHRRAQAGE